MDNTVDHPFMLAEIYVPEIDTRNVPTGQRDAGGQEITKPKLFGLTCLTRGSCFILSPAPWKLRTTMRRKTK
ncbi:hypothetical protein [Selenomonas sp. AB3002]|uniref:hypothetical protein n=1 Tax=Selenomonas sp. AB3002 TaxID=1392502 RepID=UPI00049517D4